MSNFQSNNKHQELNGEEWASLKIDRMDKTENYEISNYGRIKSFKRNDQHRTYVMIFSQVAVDNV